MYKLKVLSGKNVGKTYTLSNSETIIGRASDCDVQIPSENISKQHAKIVIDPQKVVLADLNSTNGSFVNGVQVEISVIESGDKISLYDTVLQFSKDKTNFSLATQNNSANKSLSMNTESVPKTGLDKLDDELEKRVMSPFYLFMEKVDFKLLVSLFAFGFVIITSLLSTIPLMSIIKDSVAAESKSRAKSLAKLIAISNQEALKAGRFSSLNVDLGFKEPGVKKAVIIRQATGEIIAPAIMSGTFLQGPKEGKVNTYRKLTDRPHHTFNAGGNTIISMYPTKFYSQTDGLEITKFYTVVVYNSQALALSNSHTINLFVQTLFLALLFGSVLLYILLHIVNYPLVKLKNDLLYTSTEFNTLKTNIANESLKDIYISINSLLVQAKEGGSGDSDFVSEVDRSFEIQNLTEMVGYACLIISGPDEVVLDYNPYFEELTNLYDLKGSRVSEIADTALQQNINDLIERLRDTPESMEQNDFEFSGVPYKVKMHGVNGGQEIAYYICVFIPAEGDE
jgi:pSer/pThr/pTyr-binding forkhead associated (FHA) protein